VTPSIPKLYASCRHGPDIKSTILWFHRTITGRAVEVAAILGLDNLEALGDALDLYNPRQLILRRKHGNAARSATPAPQIFNPMVADGHRINMHRIPKRSYVVKKTLRQNQKGPLQKKVVDLSKVDHATIAERGHTRMMSSKSKTLTREEFASLLTVGNTSVNQPPTIIPAEHSARLIGLGYMADLAGRLRMTTPGRRRISSGTRKHTGLTCLEEFGLSALSAMRSIARTEATDISPK
jgi:hypothetical protein